MDIVAIRPLSRDVGITHALHYKLGSTDVLHEGSGMHQKCDCAWPAVQQAWMQADCTDCVARVMDVL